MRLINVQKDIWVWPPNIITVESLGKTGTKVWLTNDRFLIEQDKTPDQVAQLINEKLDFLESGKVYSVEALVRNPDQSLELVDIG